MTATLFQRAFRPSLRPFSCRTFFANNSITTRSNPLPHRFFSTSSPSQLRYHLSRAGRRSQNIGFLDRIPQNSIFYGIIGLNGLVFVMWYMSTAKYVCASCGWLTCGEDRCTQYNKLETRRRPVRVRLDAQELYSKLAEFDFGQNVCSFLPSQVLINSLSLLDLLHCYRWTTLTCCFSHQNLPHILMNGFTFYFMAQPVQQILGNKQFLLLYLGGTYHIHVLLFQTTRIHRRWSLFVVYEYRICQGYG